MAEVTIPKEKMDYTIDLLITMVTEEISEETGKDRKEILTDFLCSRTGKALYDEKTKLWCNGPAYITELYREELKRIVSNNNMDKIKKGAVTVFTNVGYFKKKLSKEEVETFIRIFKEIVKQEKFE